MASNDEGQGSGDCDDVYRAADEFLSILGTINFVIYAYDMLLLFLPSLSLSVAQLYMLHIIDSCDDAGA